MEEVKPRVKGDSSATLKSMLGQYKIHQHFNALFPDLKTDTFAQTLKGICFFFYLKEVLRLEKL